MRPHLATQHPSPDRIAAFGLGHLSEQEADAVENHLAWCEACAGRLDHLPNDPFLVALRDAARFANAPPVCTADRPTQQGSLALTQTNRGTRAPHPAPDALPELVSHPRYRLGGLIGRGGMGAVYAAEHTLMGRPVALKVIAHHLLEHPGAADRFHQEVRAAARLHHPNIVTAFDAEQVGLLTVLVMEFVASRSLADHLKERGPLPVAEACEYARQAASGLAHAHAAGMVHRDVKPHNLMLAADGRVKILDFGLARFVSEEPAGSPPELPLALAGDGLTHTGACMGTLDYMAPEQAEDARTADARADVHALGCTLYQLLTGQVPFPGGSGADKLARLRQDEPAGPHMLRPAVPAKLAAVVQRMMAKCPEDRFQSAEEVAAVLTPFAEAARPKRRWWRWALAGLLMTLVGAAVASGVVKITTERGEVVIETDDPDIEVVVKGDRIVRITDPKSGKEYTLDRQELTLAQTDGDGLQVTLDGKAPVVLKRNGAKIATLRLEPPKPAAVAAPTSPARPKIVPVSVIPASLKSFGKDAPIAHGLSISPDGRLAISVGGRDHDPKKASGMGWMLARDQAARVWDVCKRPVPRRLATSVTIGAFSPVRRPIRAEEPSPTRRPRAILA